MAAYCEPCSPWWSRTIRTARSRTSGEKGGVRFVMGSILSGSGASEKPGAVHVAPIGWVGQITAVEELHVLPGEEIAVCKLGQGGRLAQEVHAGVDQPL